MTDTSPEESGWFEGVDPDDTEAAAEAVRDGRAETPRDWPTLAVESGMSSDSVNVLVVEDIEGV